MAKNYLMKCNDKLNITQIPEIETKYKHIYIPFCGSLNTLKYFLDKYPHIDTIHISDPCDNLVYLYFCITHKTEEFINIFQTLTKHFDYYKCRHLYNKLTNEQMMLKSVLYLILNRSSKYDSTFHTKEIITLSKGYPVNWSFIEKEIHETAKYLKNQKVLLYQKDWKSICSSPAEDVAFWLVSANDEMNDFFKSKKIKVYTINKYE